MAAMTRRLVPWSLGLAALAPASSLAGPGDLAAPEPAPKAIHGGLDAATCQFPSAVAMLDQASESLFCTGSLVHPQVVLLAAHCIDPNYSWATPGYAAFGEHADAPAFKVPVERCGFHPKWMNQDFDLAACVLAEPVDGVPIVPLLMGCEADQLAPGSEVTIVGFGADHAVYEGGEVIAEGAGPKRYTTQIVTELLPEWLDILMVGQGSGGCFGDSGGPAMLQLADGSWRVLGAASTIHPDAPEDDELCDYGTVYDMYWPEIAWLEWYTETDLTPCHTSDGGWDPGPGCGSFPLSPQVPASGWGELCATPDLGGLSATCGAPHVPGPEPEPEPEPEPPPEPEPEPEPGARA
ncbi:MAG: S1 family peptidase [Myxococcales bacterium]|nr:S1 family peptidase [Myxococcales bacterium]